MSNPGFETIPGSRCLVTGSSGLVGSRLMEMLLERGAKSVVGFDLRKPPEGVEERCLEVIKVSFLSV